MANEIAFFADYVTLAYHEARNVRHLVRSGHLEKAPYRLLIDTMPTKRAEAWKKIQSLRREAASATTALEAEHVFRRAFGLSLEGLVALSENSHWSGTQRGGNRWAEIDRALVNLRDAIDTGDRKQTLELLHQLPTMRHNTGYLEEKLHSLDESCLQWDDSASC